MPLLQKKMMVMEILLTTSRNQMIKLYFLFTPNVAVAMILQKYLTATGKSLISIFKIRVMASQKVNVEWQKTIMLNFNVLVIDQIAYKMDRLFLDGLVEFSIRIYLKTRLCCHKNGSVSAHV